MKLQLIVIVPDRTEPGSWRTFITNTILNSNSEPGWRTLSYLSTTYWHQGRLHQSI